MKGVYHFDGQLYAHGIGGTGSLGNLQLVREKNGVLTTMYEKQMNNDLSFSVDVRLEQDDLVDVMVVNSYVANEVSLILEWYLGYSASDGFFSGRLVVKE